MSEFEEIIYLGVKIKVNRSGDIIYKNKIRKPYLNKDKYLVCSINIPNVGWRSVSVHRIVAIAFIPNPNNLPEVNHKDYNRQNPHSSNLEWISRKDNILYSIKNRKNYFGENNPNYGNRKLSNIYKDNQKYAKEKQGRPGLKNGRCRKIEMYSNGILIEKFDLIEDCCIYINKLNNTSCKINSIRSQIDAALRNNRPYKNFTFIKK